MIAITAATGQLGRLVLKHLRARVGVEPLVAVVRDPGKAADLAAAGIAVRVADYEDPAAMERALAGVSQALLISSNEIGRRAAQHRHVIGAAQRAGVARIVYTSLLHADRSPLALAHEHRETEAVIRASGLDFVLLRNGWYAENYGAAVPSALKSGVFLGSAGAGKIALAAREDLAEAAAVVLAAPPPGNTVHELAGDVRATLADYAHELSRQAGRPIPYQDLPEADYRAALVGAGLPEAWAAMLAGFDACAAQGALDDESRELSRLLGRPTQSLEAMVRTALQPI